MPPKRTTTGRSHAHKVRIHKHSKQPRQKRTLKRQKFGADDDSRSVWDETYTGPLGNQIQAMYVSLDGCYALEANPEHSIYKKWNTQNAQHHTFFMRRVRNKEGVKVATRLKNDFNMDWKAPGFSHMDLFPHLHPSDQMTIIDVKSGRQYTGTVMKSFVKPSGGRGGYRSGYCVLELAQSFTPSSLSNMTKTTNTTSSSTNTAASSSSSSSSSSALEMFASSSLSSAVPSA